MPFTNYTFEFKGIIDYIFYAKNTMTPLGLLGPISAEWLTQNKVIGCPHPHVYSDHFALLVELEMVPTLTTPINGIIRAKNQVKKGSKTQNRLYYAPDFGMNIQQQNTLMLFDQNLYLPDAVYYPLPLISYYTA